ncbi:malate synthase G [Bacillaceae bacterium IKA-2]|nr:malate synthase G [Bacillaceae bacterium IKA-2]
MRDYLKVGKLQIARVLYEFVNNEAIPGTGMNSEKFWSNFEALVTELMPENKALLARREEIQNDLNEWHKQNRESFQFAKYKEFLEELGYLEPEVENFEITTEAADDEIVLQAGPQLVVPVNNARYAINAANARWGSLYDALYGTDAISDEGDAAPGKAYNPVRGEKVISYAKNFLDQAAPLVDGTHQEVVQYSIIDGELAASLSGGKTRNLQEGSQLIGYNGEPEAPTVLLLKNNGLHFEIQVDRNHPIGKTDKAGVKDILMEAALTTIMDFEDSVTAVDAEDKVEVYRNWLGLMKGDLTASFKKGDKTITRSLNPDPTYLSVSGETFTLPGRSLMFVRNVGHLMTNSAILIDEQEVPEGMIDGLLTALISTHDIIGNSCYKNSNKGSIYIVKPKMHGSLEVAFANKLFDRIEDLLGLARNTIKIGVMDEERRTSLNLKNCIHQVKERIVFINTGFLDRTGDEIHTSLEAGPVIRKNDMKSSTWLQAYEKSNVAVGITTGLPGRAQIGKGMWAMPDLMADMLAQKIGHLKTGANTAWVPSPTAASLHALHYHQIDVNIIQKSVANNLQTGLTDEMLTFPVEENPDWSLEEIQQELDNNAQGILGYVVRWVEHGVGCSKVPDINNVGLMEDRATLRISSQHMANWLHHGICTEEQVMETMKRMAKVVDKQNANDPLYHPMAKDYDDSVAFQAACEFIIEGRSQPSGYTEPILHRRRQEAKAKFVNA